MLVQHRSRITGVIGVERFEAYSRKMSDATMPMNGWSSTISAAGRLEGIRG
jgi:hypothetical protein